MYTTGLYIPCVFISVYSPVHKKAGFIRAKSIDQTPSLPKHGAQMFAKHVKEEEIARAEFMKTPNAGVAG